MKRTSRCSKNHLNLRSSLRHASDRANLKVGRSGIWGVAHGAADILLPLRHANSSKPSTVGSNQGSPGQP